MLLNFFVYIPLKYLRIVYEHTQNDKWVCEHTHDGILLVRVATCECR
jgi:hypothetical protein